MEEGERREKRKKERNRVISLSVSPAKCFGCPASLIGRNGHVASFCL